MGISQRGKDLRENGERYLRLFEARDGNFILVEKGTTATRKRLSVEKIRKREKPRWTSENTEGAKARWSKTGGKKRGRKGQKEASAGRTQQILQGSKDEQEAGLTGGWKKGKSGRKRKEKKKDCFIQQDNFISSLMGKKKKKR